MLINLSTIYQDAEAILAQLQAAAAQSDTFKDFYTGSTGFTLLETQAAVGALNCYSSESALQESMLLFAKNDSSVYAYTAGQGVRIGRKVPASCPVTLTRTDTSLTQTIPEMSQFTIGGVFMFNRDALTFGIGVATLHPTLYQGKVVQQSIYGIGEDFQLWVSPEADFTVADGDVRLTANSTPIPVAQDGLWNYSGVNAVQDVTSPKGRLMLKFGNALFGLKPEIDTNLVITYAVTDGAVANDSNFSGTTFTFSIVTGITTGGLEGGDNEKPAGLYKSVTPALWGAHDSAVTRSQYLATAMQYPGVKDVKFFAQRELSVTDNRYMNLFKVVVLPVTPWGDTEKANFVTWFQKRAMYSGRYYFEDPRAQASTIVADMYVRNTVNPATAKVRAEAAISQLFQPRFGMLGTTVYLSDIELAIFNSEKATKFVRIQSPIGDIFVGITPPEVVATPDTAHGGALPAGSYVYAVTAVNAVGETSISSYPSALLASTGRVILTWAAVPNATAYRIYGRTPDGIGKLAQVAATVLTYTDAGATSPNGVIPAIDTSGVWYATAPSITVNVLFSGRVPFNGR